MDFIIIGFFSFLVDFYIIENRSLDFIENLMDKILAFLEKCYD